MSITAATRIRFYGHHMEWETWAKQDNGRWKHVEGRETVSAVEFRRMLRKGKEMGFTITEMEETFKKVVTTYKGWKIEQTAEHTFNVYTADEWAYGAGLREIEWEAGTMKEATDFIDNY